MRLVCEILKTVKSQRTDATSKALNLCTEKKKSQHPKHLLMHQNEHFKMFPQDKEFSSVYYFLCAPKREILCCFVVVVTENSVELCSMFV